MTIQRWLTIPLALGFAGFVPTDGYGQGRPGSRGSGSGGMSGGCRSSGGQTSSSPPAMSSSYPRPPAYASAPAYMTPSAPSSPRSPMTPSASYLQYAAQQAYLAQLQAAQLQSYQVRFAAPQTVQLTSARAPAAPAKVVPPKEAWSPPAADPEFVPTETATISPDPIAILAADPATYDLYLKAVVRKDDAVVRDIDAAGKVLFLREPAEVAVLSRSNGFAFVRFLAGEHKNKAFVTRAKLTTLPARPGP